MFIRAYFSGTCEPNRDYGLMIYEVIIYRDYVKVRDFSEVYERADHIASNNIAEYVGLISVLNWVIHEQFKCDFIHIFTDSQLIEGQMVKGWNIKTGKYKNYAERAAELYHEVLCRKNYVKIEYKPVKKNMLSIPNLLGNPDYDRLSDTTRKCNDITQLFLERQNKL